MFFHASMCLFGNQWRLIVQAMLWDAGREQGNGKNYLCIIIPARGQDFVWTPMAW